jgi:hypothetical protein
MNVTIVFLVWAIVNIKLFIINYIFYYSEVYLLSTISIKATNLLVLVVILYMHFNKYLLKKFCSSLSLHPLRQLNMSVT